MSQLSASASSDDAVVNSRPAKRRKEFEPKSLPIINCRFVENALEQHGYEVRCIAAGFDGKRKWVVHRRDPSTGTHYNDRSYFDGEGLLSLAHVQSKQELRDSIVASQAVKLKYIKIRGEDKVKKTTTKKTTTAAEREARNARASKSTKKAPASKAGKGTKAAAPKKAARVNGKGEIDLSDPDVKLLAGYQDKTTTERMTAPNMVNLFRRLKAATLDNPVANSSLNAYDKRQARELARLGLVQKEKVEGVGLGYFAAK